MGPAGYIYPEDYVKYCGSLSEGPGEEPGRYITHEEYKRYFGNA